MKIKVLLFMPGREAQLIKIPASTKFIKSFIIKEIYMYSFFDLIITF